METNDIKMKILLAAKKLFASQGFEGTSVRQICEEAGGNVALVSYHFGGKENVFFEIFETFFPAWQLEKYEEQLKDPVVGLELIIDGVLRFKTEDPELFTILQREFNMLTARVNRIQNYTFPVWLKLRELLDKGRQQELFHFRSLDHTMIFIMASLLYPECNCAVEALLTEGEQKLEDIIQDTTIFIFRGLGYPL